MATAQTFGVNAVDVQGKPFQGVKEKAPWLERKSNHKHIDSVAVFAVGYHKGKFYTKADLADAVRAYEPTLNQIKPVIKLGHDDAQSFSKLVAMGTDPKETSLGLPNLGFPDALRTNDKPVTDPLTKKTWNAGELLFADFVNLPEKVHDDIVNHRYIERSAEIINNYVDKERPGVVWPKVLRAVSLLGDELPAVRGGMPMMTFKNSEGDTVDIVTFSEGDLPMAVGTPVTASTDQKLDKVLAAIMQLIDLQKKDNDNQTPADMAAKEAKDNALTKEADKTEEMAAKTPPVPPAGPPADEKKSEMGGIDIHAENAKIVQLRTKAEAAESKAAQALSEVLRMRAENAEKTAKQESETFAESVCCASNFRIPPTLKDKAAKLHRMSPEVQKFTETDGTQATFSFRQEFSEFVNALPLIADASRFKDRAKDFKAPEGNDPVATAENEVNKMAEKLMETENLPWHKALLKATDSMTGDQFKALMGMGSNGNDQHGF